MRPICCVVFVFAVLGVPRFAVSQAASADQQELKKKVQACGKFQVLVDKDTVSVKLATFLKGAQIANSQTLANATFTAFFNDSIQYYNCLGDIVRTNGEHEQTTIELLEIVDSASDALLQARSLDAPMAARMKVILDAKKALLDDLNKQPLGDHLQPKLDNSVIVTVIPIRDLTLVREISAGIDLAYKAVNINASFGKAFSDNLAGDVYVSLEAFNRAWRSYIAGDFGPKLLKVQLITTVFAAAGNSLQRDKDLLQPTDLKPSASPAAGGAAPVAAAPKPAQP